MKFKKIVLFILIFLFFLLLSTNVKGYVLSEGGTDKYYLKDLPFDDSESSVYESVFLFDSSNNIVYVLKDTGDYDNFCYEPRSNRIYLFDKNRSRVGFNYYTCSVELNNDIYVGGDWTSNFTSSWLTINNNYIFIGGTSCIYPGISSINNHLVTSLPSGVNWGDNILIGVSGKSLYLFVFTKVKGNVLTADSSNGYVYYRPSYNSSEYIRFSCYTYDYNTSSWTLGNSVSSTNPSGASVLLYYDQDILSSSDGSVLWKSTSNIFKGLYEYNSFPYILNTQEDLAKGEEDLIIMPGDFKNTEKVTFGLQCVEKSTLDDGSEYEKITNVIEPIKLDLTSKYYCSVDESGVGFYYKIPWSYLKNYLVKDKQYVYVISYEYNGNEYQNDIYATFGGLSDSDIIKNSLAEQTAAINNNFTELQKLMNTLNQEQQKVLQEQVETQKQIVDTQKEANETSKGIWGTLKDVLSYINPFSENFFVYKLIDLLVNALKSLFIPSNDFLSNYFEKLKNWFSDRLGFLSYPLELILDILNRILSINFEEPIIQIPNFVEPSTNETIIHSRTYNLNSLLENNIFKTCHDVYFILVDAVIVFGLVNLLKHKLEEVFTK